MRHNLRNDANRFRKRITERDLGYGKIHFLDTRHLQIDMASYSVIFHRWYQPSNPSRKHWCAFEKALKRNKAENLDIYTVYKLADRYEIEYQITTRRIIK